MQGVPRTYLKNNPSGNSLPLRLLLLLVILLPDPYAISQTFLYFQDSPSSDYYDYSWMELTPPSELERKGSDLRKFPVETLTVPIQGVNSLRLKWKSAAGGDWVAIAAGTNWTEKDISLTDTLQFWLYSVEGLDSTDLPRIFMEDVTNAKTTRHIFSSWCAALPSGQWIRIAIPMSLFLDAGDPVDFTRIKTIGFAQHHTEGIQHTLFVDNMKVFAGDGTSPAASKPAGIAAKGYDSHIELRWMPNPEDYVTGYVVQRSLDGGATFNTIATSAKEDTIITDHLKSFGSNVTAYYRVFALNASAELSVPSDTVFASTREFTDDEMLDMVQEYTFRYFWNFAHPASGMARERNTSGNTVTTGGTGFGIMAILVGIERGFITRDQGIARMQKILDFLESADRFHGAWPHWLDGNTGNVIPFSTYDNGGDLVETGFLVQGLLAARQYFNMENTEEKSIVQKITSLWEDVEWDWYRKNESDVLYWHWSPNYQWQMNMQIRGWNEAAIIYMLAIASPTHGIPASLWHIGWAGTSNYLNGKTFYGYKLDVGWDKGGPLFFAHYSFLGFDPRQKHDAYANYFNNNQSHTLINRAYCIQNPLGFAGYGENCWGLTASDDPDGYLAHEPASGRDNGTITPTAALSSMPYTPEESMNALKYLYRELGNKIWGPMGFHDAFNEQCSWYASSYLAIDQGPIIDMIENYRSSLLWNNFMANNEIGPMLDAIGFTEDLTSGIDKTNLRYSLMVVPNPAGPDGMIRFSLAEPAPFNITVTDLAGHVLYCLASGDHFSSGEYQYPLNHIHLSPGIYLLRLQLENHVAETIKIVIQY
jgi:hypothetical protein